MDTQQDIERYLLEQGTHRVLKERMDVLNRVLPVISDGSVTGKINELLSFFQGPLLRHIQLEDDLIANLRSCDADTADEAMVIEDVMKDHRRIRSKVSEVAVMAASLDINDRERKELFVETVHALIEDALDHAAREDKVFYPMARRRCAPEKPHENP